MGISADLIEFCQDGEYRLTDMNEVITLYEFLPKELHYMIRQSIEDVYDFSKYSSEVSIIYTNGDVQLQNGLLISYDECEYIELTVNFIRYNIVRYIGNSNIFADDIYSMYEQKKYFKYLWKISDSIIQDEMINEQILKYRNNPTDQRLSE